MLSFATEFPVKSAETPLEFVDAIRRWVLGSPYSCFCEEDLEGLHERSDWKLSKQNEQLVLLFASNEAEDAAAARYSRTDAELEWTTTIVYSRRSGDAWVGVRVWCESVHPAVNLPEAKKPVVVRTLLHNLGEGIDGSLQVRNVPHYLRDVDIDLAGNLIRGVAGCRLPIVYASSNFRGGYPINVERLARDLAGMAHVVVEPNRPFSIRLQLQVDSENVYGGTVGVYWPEGAGRRSFYVGGAYSAASDLAGAIVEEIRSALVNRRPLERCTWSNVQAIHSRATYDALQAEGSQEVNRYIDEFDQAIDAERQKLADAEREIARLEREIRKLEARLPLGSGVQISTGSEQDLYPGEIADIVRDALEDAEIRTVADSRRRHVLRAVLAANAPFGEAGRIRERLKNLLRGTTTLDARTKKGLEELGFAIFEDGKHFKVLFQGDDRYTFALPKSGSDWRGGLNASSDISRLLL